MSAMVLETLSIRSYALAESPKRSMAVLSNDFPAALISHVCLTTCEGIMELQNMSEFFLKRSVCTCLPIITQLLMDLLYSAFCEEVISSNLTGVTSTCKSILSNNGPLILFRYF